MQNVNFWSFVQLKIKLVEQRYSVKQEQTMQLVIIIKSCKDVTSLFTEELGDKSALFS